MFILIATEIDYFKIALTVNVGQLCIDNEH